MKKPTRLAIGIEGGFSGGEEKVIYFILVTATIILDPLL